MYFFQGPLHGLCDALILSKKGNFSTIRSFGAVGYALAVFTAGEIAEEMGLKNIFYIYSLAYVVTFALIISEQEPPYERPAGEKISGKHLFKNKTYLKLMISVFFVMGTNVANSTYFGYLFREGGGSVAGIGTAFLLMAGSEAPFMALTPMLVRRFTSEKLILFAMVLSSLRFGFYATGPGAAALLATFFLQGAVNGILLVEVVKYFNKIVSPQYSGVAIALFYAFGNSFSVIVCSLLGGIILDMASAKTVYLFFCIYNLIAVFLYISLGLYKEKKNDI